MPHQSEPGHTERVRSTGGTQRPKRVLCKVRALPPPPADKECSVAACATHRELPSSVSLLYGKLRPAMTCRSGSQQGVESAGNVREEALGSMVFRVQPERTFRNSWPTAPVVPTTAI
jgi:hypothetical protein